MEVLGELESPRTACCAEWLPGTGTTDAALVAFGAYELDKATQERIGCVQLVRLEQAAEGLSARVVASETEPGGVFDLKWCGGDHAWLAAASADGKCHVRRGAQHEAADWEAVDTRSGPGEDCAEQTRFCLSLDWSNRRSGDMANARLCVSRSDGRVSEIAVTESSLEHTREWLAHEYAPGTPAEVWIAAYDCWDPSVVATGADDGLLKLWDLRAGTDAPTRISRAHEAGVCCVQFSTLRENVFATGSYDGKIRVFDKRQLKQPTCEPLDVQAGVWRVKWHPTDPQLLAAACMRSGFLTVRHDDAELRELQNFRAGHALGGWEALGYGVDWVLQAGSRSLLASASFYDRGIRILDPQLTPSAASTAAAAGASSDKTQS